MNPTLLCATAAVAVTIASGCSSSSTNAPGATQASAGADPSAVVRTFYDWDLVQPSNLPGVHDWMKDFGDNRAIFDPGLFAMIQQGVKLNASDPVFDFDPFTNGQVGFKGYALGTPVPTGEDVKIPVAVQSCLSCDKETPWPAAFTPSPWPSAGGQVAVVVRKNADGVYVIYDFTYQDDSLRGYLQKTLEKP